MRIDGIEKGMRRKELKEGLEGEDEMERGK